AHDQPAGLAVPRVVPVHGEVCAAVGAVQPEPERAVGPWYVDRLPGGDPQLRPGVVANRLRQRRVRPPRLQLGGRVDEAPAVRPLAHDRPPTPPGPGTFLPVSRD